MMRFKHKKAFSVSAVLIGTVFICCSVLLFFPLFKHVYELKTNHTKVKNFYLKINSDLYENNKKNTQEINYPNTRDAEIFFKKFEPFLLVTKDCNTTNAGKCIYSGSYKLLNGKTFNNYAASNLYYKVRLSDGSALWIRPSLKLPICNEKDGGYENSCGMIWLDLNAEKEPNTIGKDVYVFVILKDKIAPYKEKSNVKGIKGDCAMGGGGWGCAEKIINSDKFLKI